MVGYVLDIVLDRNKLLRVKLNKAKYNANITPYHWFSINFWSGSNYARDLMKIPSSTFWRKQIPNFQNVFCLWIRHHHIIKSSKIFWRKQEYSYPCISSNTASPEFMVMMEEIWNLAKRDILVLQSYTSSADFKSKISRYFRRKRFNLNIMNYLREVRQYMLIGIASLSIER